MECTWSRWPIDVGALYHTTNEPLYDKTNNVVVRPAKTQISLGIRPV